MKIPEYISKEEVQRVCQELGIRDWTQLSAPEVQADEARIIQAEIGGEAGQIPLDEFRLGLAVELEHGLQYPDGPGDRPTVGPGRAPSPLGELALVRAGRRRPRES